MSAGEDTEEWLELENWIQEVPCLRQDCGGRCEQCRLAQLLQERFLPDLNQDLKQIVSCISLQKFTRPAGSFRFRASRFPGDIDIYEYLHIEARDKQAALAKLADMLKELAARIKAGLVLSYPDVLELT